MTVRFRQRKSTFRAAMEMFLLAVLLFASPWYTLALALTATTIGRMLRAGTEGDVSSLPMHLKDSEIKTLAVIIMTGLCILAGWLSEDWRSPLVLAMGVTLTVSLAWPCETVDRTDPDGVIEIEVVSRDSYESCEGGLPVRKNTPGV